MLSKIELRRKLLEKRQSLPYTVWKEKSDRLCQQLQTCPLYQQADTVLAYFSTRQEPDLSSLFNSNKNWAFPRCVGKTLAWHCWQPNQPLNQGKYGILEPCQDLPLIMPPSVDLILVPSVACDRHGYRLGYGAGFYDRLFSDLAWQSTPTLGITFDFAYISQLPIDTWDIPLKGICTDQQWQLFSKHQK